MKGIKSAPLDTPRAATDTVEPQWVEVKTYYIIYQKKIPESRPNVCDLVGEIAQSSFGDFKVLN